MRKKILTLAICIPMSIISFQSCNENEDEDTDDKVEVEQSADKKEKESIAEVDKKEDGTSAPSPNLPEKDCTEKVPLLVEENGIIRFEAEAGIFGDEWQLLNDKPNTFGEGYLFWNGNNFFTQPEVATITYKIQIKTPGTYIIYS